MLEHVGAAHYREFGRVADRCLGPAGRGLIQSIGQDQPSDDQPVDRTPHLPRRPIRRRCAK